MSLRKWKGRRISGGRLRNLSKEIKIFVYPNDELAEIFWETENSFNSIKFKIQDWHILKKAKK